MSIPDLDKRIEAAARESAIQVGDLADEAWEGHVEDITGILKAFAPELFTDPPQSWLAPWEITDEMDEALQSVAPDEYGWNAMRDAHLAKTENSEHGQAE